MGEKFSWSIVGGGVMNNFIDITQQQFLDVWQHVLPVGAVNESAAFMFAEFEESNNSLVLKAKDYLLIGPEGFAAQHDDYIELSNETRISIIKKAHQTNTALIELHSHPFDSYRSAAFSRADMIGFSETVPHMFWRLPARPYVAIVVSPRGFDSLVWLKDPISPAQLTALRVDGKQLLPTNMTLGGKYVSGK
jgi:hypothetical protein